MAWRKEFCWDDFLCVWFRWNVMSFVRGQNYNQTVGLQVVLRYYHQNIPLLWWHHENTAILFFEVPFKCHDMNVIITYHSYTTVLEQTLPWLWNTVFFHGVCYVNTMVLSVYIQCSVVFCVNSCWNCISLHFYPIHNFVVFFWNVYIIKKSTWYYHLTLSLISLSKSDYDYIRLWIYIRIFHFFTFVTVMMFCKYYKMLLL